MHKNLIYIFFISICMATQAFSGANRMPFSEGIQSEVSTQIEEEFKSDLNEATESKFKPTEVDRVFNGDTYYSRAEKYLESKFSVYRNYSPDHYSQLISVFEQFRKNAKERKDSSHEEFYTFAITQMEKSKDSANEQIKKDIYGSMVRLFYSILVDSPMEIKTRVDMIKFQISKLSKMMSRNYKLIERQLLAGFIFHIPYVKDSELNEKLGSNAKKESKNLYLAGSNSPITEVEMASLTSEELSRLDISPNHLMWWNEKQLKKIHNEYGEPFNKVESWINESTSKILSQSGKYKDEVKYDVNKAKKVLFYDEIKKSDTSPKVNAVDAYNIKWKVKWGEEVQTQAVASRLYLKLGGKFALPVYVAKKGKEEFLMILSEPNKKSNKECESLVTADDFVRCMKKSVYNADLSYHIDETGMITEKNVDDILMNIKDFVNYAELRSKAIGRNYISFKETQLTMTPPKQALVKGGGIAMSSLGEMNDRVMRGLMIFNFWIGNIDNKDHNCASFLLKKFINPDSTDYIEAQTDFGASFGGFLTEGQLNLMDVGEDFVGLHKISGNELLYFKENMGYFPRPWKATTYADALWMARKISKLSLEEIESIVSVTKWPDFMQKAMTYRLIARRNQIAKYFRLPILQYPAPTVTVDLSSSEKIESTARKYNLSPEAIQTELMKNKLQNHSETLLNSGVLEACEKTVLIGLLEREHYPSGLTKRVGRMYDNLPQPSGCHYGDEPRPSDFRMLLKGMRFKE